MTTKNPRINLPSLKKVITSVPEVGSTMMKILLDEQIPVASSCAGDGVCGKCQVQVLQGMENLTPPTEAELFLKEKNQWPADIRLSCQCQVLGEITVTTKYW